MIGHFNPEQRSARAAWLLSAASLGSVAGLPWVFVLQGPLVSVVFAVFAVLRANQLWRGTTGRFGGPLAGIALASAVVVGHPASSTWPDRCFELLLSNGKDLQDWLLVLALVGLGALVCLAALDFELSRRLRRLQTPNVQFSDQTSKLALWVGLAGIAWSVTNEIMMPNLVYLIVGFGRGEAPRAGFRDPCNPEVGWFALVLYVTALVLLWRGRVSSTQGSPAPNPSAQRASRAAQTVLWVGLVMAQSARTNSLLHRQHRLPEEGGARIDCGCYKYNHGNSAIIR